MEIFTWMVYNVYHTRDDKRDGGRGECIVAFICLLSAVLRVSLHVSR